MTAELIAQFTPENFGEWCRGRFDRFISDFHPVADSGEFVRADIVGYVQSLPDADTNRPLLVMAVHAGANINERSSRRLQFDFACKQLLTALDRPPAKVKGLFTQGLFAFYDDAGNFRLSLITGRAEGRGLVYGDFRRQSFFVAPDPEKNKTFRARMASPFGAWKNLVEAFSVETLTKEFYNSLFTWYERAMDPSSKISFPNDLARDDDDRHTLSEHLIRLITRLMFVWFIRQKKLIPKELFDIGDLRQLLTRFDPLSPKQDNYYRAILQNLFFATLNCEIAEREFAIEGTRQQNKEHYGIKILYRYQDEFACPTEKVKNLFRTVPFLNGGLFECLDRKHGGSPRSPVIYHDGFSREPSKRAHIPNNLFFDEYGLVTLFSRYDFTVDENSPNDADVALDPELLGKVFENLLGAYNPETRQTARKQSGSFYTPREIVNYMVDESLKAHLLTKLGQAFLPRIEALFAPDEQDVPFNDTERHELVKALYGCRILDPACGSGAFPMGVLHKMVYLLQRFDPKNALWHEVVMAEAERDLAEAEAMSPAEKTDRRRRISESFDQSVNQPDYARKLYLIENCIFGVDIQSIAVQIAKLRAFITLVCDQTPTADAEKNYGMLPLPNLETKFVAANTLIGLTTDFADGLKTADGVSLLNDPELQGLRAGLTEVRHRHFRARNAPEKNKCRKLDNELRGKIRGCLVEIAAKPNTDKIALWQAEIGKRHQQRKEVEKEDWREVAQTMPAQIDMFETAPKPVQTMLRMDVNKERRDRIDDEIRRFTHDIEVEQNRAKNKGAFQHEADRLAAWDPYDQNASSPFFDPEWMFDLKDGFDIVLGNPPYSAKQSTTMKALRALYAYVEYKCDPFAFFIEWAMCHSKKSSGHVAFIVPVTWMTNVYYEKLRRFLIDSSLLARAVLIRGMVFESANVDTSLLFLCSEGSKNGSFEWMLTDPLMKSRVLSQRTYESVRREHRYDITPTADPGWDRCRAKLENEALRLGSFAKISLGMKLARNEDFVVAVRDGKHPDPIIFGSDVRMYGPLVPSRFFKFASATIVGGTKNPAVQKARPKIVVQAIRNLSLSRRIVAAIDTHGWFFVGTVNSIIPHTGEWTPLYLLGLLNSTLLNVYFRRRFTTISLTAAFLGELPIMPQDAQPLLSNKIVALVTRILDTKMSYPEADTSSLEREIDEIVYRIYNLTPDEIAIVEGREAGGNKAAASVKPAKAAAGAKKTRKSILTEDPDLA